MLEGKEPPSGCTSEYSIIIIIVIIIIISREECKDLNAMRDVGFYIKNLDNK